MLITKVKHRSHEPRKIHRTPVMVSISLEALQMLSRTILAAERTEPASSVVLRSPFMHRCIVTNSDIESYISSHE